MKKIICLITVILLLPSIFCFAELPLYTNTTLDIDNPEPLEKEFWDYINAQSPNEWITASLMGIIYRESNFRSNAVAGWYLAKWADISTEFTERIDAGLQDDSSLDDFVHTSRYVHGGYGLIQWCMPHTLKLFYHYMQERETTIADIKAQIDFTFWDLKTNHYVTWDFICNTAPDLYTVNWWLATYYEGTQSYGTTFYYTYIYDQRYAGK